MVGIAPLYATRTATGACLRWIGTGISDRLGLIAAPAVEAKTAEAVVEWLEQYPCVDLHQVSDGSWTARLTEARGWLTVFQEKCPYVALPETWDAYAGSLSKKMRFNLSYAMRQMQRELGEVQMDTACAEQLPEAMEALFHLHTQRWRQRGLPGGFFHPRVRQFHQEWMWMAYARGWLRLHTLRVSGAIKAVLYVFHLGRGAYYYLGGFDTSLARYSMGTVLTGYAIRRAIEEGCVVFDFLRGDEAYKHRWRPQIQWHRRACHARGAFAWVWRKRVEWETLLWRYLQARLHGKKEVL